MKVKHLYSLFFALVVLLSACKDNECTNRNGVYSSGIFVVNEGLFGGSGTITWHDPVSGETVQDVYGQENYCGALGQFVQSLTFHNGLGYIVVNGANKIVVVDAATFKYRGVINGLELPRFILPVSDQFAYVSQWGADGVSGSLAKVDLFSRQIVKTIAVGSGPEKMVLSGNTLIVTNSGGYGVDSTLVAVDITTDNIIQKYPATGKNPSSLVLEQTQGANALYLCKGYYLDPVPSGNLNRMTGGSPAGIATPAYADDLVIDDSGAIFFTANTQIFQVTVNGSQISATPLFDQNAYGLGLDATENLLYCADAKDFSAAGEVVIRKFDGTVTGSFPVGISPGEVVIVK